MTTTDVDPNARTADEERFTNHIFDLSVHPVGLPGQAIRLPANDAERFKWPPSSLFDAMYASAVIHHFGDIPAKLFKKWEAVFYPPDGPSKAGETDDKYWHAQADVEKMHHEKQRTEQQQHYEKWQCRHGDFDAFDVLRLVPFMVMPAEKARDYLKECERVAVAKEHEGLEVKVNSWRKGLSTPNND